MPVGRGTSAALLKIQNMTKRINGYTAQSFCAYLTDILIPDLKESGRDFTAEDRDFTAEDFETAVAFIREGMAEDPFNAIGSTVETVRDTRAIGGVESAHVNFAKVKRLTACFVFVENEHGNLQKHARRTGIEVGTDKLTPTRIIRC